MVCSFFSVLFLLLLIVVHYARDCSCTCTCINMQAHVQDILVHEYSTCVHVHVTVHVCVQRLNCIHVHVVCGQDSILL